MYPSRSAGYDSDDKGLFWRAMNVIVASEEKTLNVTQTLMLAKPSDNARARGIVCGYATDENTFVAEAHNDDSTLTIELAAIENSIRHSRNEIDMTDMKNTIDVQTDVITHQVLRFASSDNADVNDLSSSLCEYVIVPAVSNDTWIQSNNVEANFSG